MNSTPTALGSTGATPGWVRLVTASTWLICPGAVARTQTVALADTGEPGTMPDTGKLPSPATCASLTAAHVTGRSAWLPSEKVASTVAGSTGFVPMDVRTSIGSIEVGASANTFSSLTATAAYGPVPAACSTTRNFVVVTASNVTEFVSSRFTVYSEAPATSAQSEPVQYCAFHPFGTLTPLAEFASSWSRQKPISAPAMRCGVLHSYCSQRVAG